MFGRETFIVRVAEDAMAPRVRVGDCVWGDPDEPEADGRLVAARDPGRTVDAGNETEIRDVVVLVGNTVCAPPLRPRVLGASANGPARHRPPRCGHREGNPARAMATSSGGEVLLPETRRELATD